MRGEDRLTNLERHAAELSRGQAGKIVRYGRGGGIGDHFQIIRGMTTAAVAPSDVAFQLTSIAAYEEFASTPDAPLWVAAPAGGVTLSGGDAVWAIYRAGVLTFDPGSGDVIVDWLMLDFGASASTPPLRAFELTANKTLGSATATGRWLDLDNNMVGDPVTLHDSSPATARFSGRIAGNLFSGSPGFRGFALLRTDLAAEDPDQWDIVAMDSLCEFVKAKLVKRSNYPGAGSTVYAYYYGRVNSEGYDIHDPADGVSGGQLGYQDDPEIFDVDVAISEPEAGGHSASFPVLMELSDPDATPPKYRVCEAKGIYRNRPLDPGEDGALIVNSVDSIELALTSAGALTVKINYSKFLVFGTAFGSGDTENTLDIWDQADTVTDVACDDGALVITKDPRLTAP